MVGWVIRDGLSFVELLMFWGFREVGWFCKWLADFCMKLIFLNFEV